MTSSLCRRLTTASLAGSLALAVTAAAVPTASADPFGSSGVAAAAEPSGTAQSATGTVRMTGDRHQGLPGQFESAYSAKTHRLYTTANAWSTKAADGSPVNGGGVVAELDPATLKVLHVGPAPVELVTGAAARRHVGLDTAYESAYPYGIAVDDTRNLVWTTETDAGTISAYDQSTLELVWRSEPGSLPHGRDVTVLRNGDVVAGGSGGLWRVTGSRQKFEIAPYSTAKGDWSTPMRMTEVGSELFVDDLSTPQVRVLDAATGTVKRSFPLAPESAGVSRGHLDVDAGLGVVVVVDQGARDKATGVYSGSGVGFYRVDGTPLGRLAVGAHNLPLAIDQQRHIAYVGDFGGNGEVRAFDLQAAAQGRPALVGQIATTSVPAGTAGVNFLTMVGDRVAVSTKDAAYKGMTLPYGVDVRTGARTAITADGDSILMLDATVSGAPYDPTRDATLAGGTPGYDTATLPMGPVPPVGPLGFGSGTGSLGDLMGAGS